MASACETEKEIKVFLSYDRPEEVKVLEESFSFFPLRFILHAVKVDSPRIIMIKDFRALGCLSKIFLVPTKLHSSLS